MRSREAELAGIMHFLRRRRMRGSLHWEVVCGIRMLERRVGEVVGFVVVVGVADRWEGRDVSLMDHVRFVLNELHFCSDV